MATAFMRLLHIGLIVALVAGRPALSLGAPPDGPRARLTVATYNVQNMMDAHDDPHTLDEEIPPKPRKKIKQVANAIRRVNADIVALEEVENEGILESLVRQQLRGMGYRYWAVNPTNSRYGLNLGVISRRPILSITSHRLMDIAAGPGTMPMRFARDLMWVRIQATDDHTLDVLIAHFKSRYGTPDDPHSIRWRTAEARATRDLVRRILDQKTGPTWLLVAGDLNAVPSSPTLDLLLKPDPSQSSRLVDLHAGLDRSQRVTYLRPPHRSTVDYLLATPALARRAVTGSARVLTRERLLYGSDHAPVFVSFDLGGDR